MSFFENTRRPQGIGGMTVYTGEQLRDVMTAAGFTDIKIEKDHKGWLCVTAQKV